MPDLLELIPKLVVNVYFDSRVTPGAAGLVFSLRPDRRPLQ